jgi:hypothetical protein
MSAKFFVFNYKKRVLQDQMDFLGLFDPRTADESGDVHDDFTDQLPPEPQVGNVEYKLKLVNPSKQRFEHLVTQVRK